MSKVVIMHLKVLVDDSKNGMSKYSGYIVPSYKKNKQLQSLEIFQPGSLQPISTR